MAMAFGAERNGHPNVDFNFFLLKIANEITNDQLRDIKFLCQQDLPRGKLELIETSRELLNFLKESGKIRPGDMQYLITLLENTGNIRLASAVIEKGMLTSLDFDNVQNLPHRTANFVGRDAVALEIIQKLTQDPDPVRMVIIVGIPGMGKTELAIHVSHLLQEEHNKSVIFIEKQEKLTDICSEILHQVGGQRLSESHDMVSIAKRRLKGLREDKVIVLDNTEDVQGKAFDGFAKYVNTYAPHVQLIITTRKDVSFSTLQIHKVPLHRLDSKSSIKLLQDSVPNCKELHLKELGELCDGTPLVLEHCACVLNDGFSPGNLIRELRQNPIKLLKTNAEEVYNDMGQFLCNISDNIKANLVRLAVFPSAFSVKDIEFLFDDLLELETVKTKLMRCTLLRRINNEKFTLHPLIREFCKVERKFLKMDAIGEATQHRFNCHYLDLLKTLSKQFVVKGLSLQAISFFRNEKANIMETFKNCLQKTSDKGEKAHCIDVVNAPEVLDFLAKVLSPPSKCTKLYQWCYDIAETSNDKRRVADCLNSLGFRRLCDVAHRKGDRDTLLMFQRAYDTRMTLPKEQQQCGTHAHTLCKLGLCYALQGEEEKGRKLIQEGIDMRKKLGVSLYVAAGYCDLGNAFRACKDHKRAIDIWKTQTLPVYKEELGDHPWTASILRYMASSYQELARSGSEDSGMADQAEMYSRQALDLRIALLGVHQDTARSHIDLSEVLIIKRDFSSAFEELKKALEIQQEVLGEEHETTKATLEQWKKIRSRVEENA